MASVEEEGGEVEDDSQNSDDLLVDDVRALVVVQGDEVGQDAHDNHGRDPDDGAQARINRREAAAGVGSAGRGSMMTSHCELGVLLNNKGRV